MPRYIDANALISDSKICGSCKDRELCGGNIAFCPNASARRAINNAPTADVKPVIHGQWIDNNCGDFVCSVCGWAFSGELPYMARKRDAKAEEIMRYCMHCGAKMK